DYYEQEIKYQQVIDKQNNLFALSKNIEFKVNKNEVTVIFPEELRGRELNGNLVFYRAVNADLDFKIPINLNDSLSQTVNFSGREPGYWKVTVDFSDGKLEYLQEKKLIIGI
ncbi:MAG: FixH family protein, partial [Ignavibacteriaceae bacterium]|nr:FixH family protein [Ignavibacteriaceae bacterium]